MRLIIICRWLFYWLLRWAWLLAPAQEIAALLFEKLHSHSSIIIVKYTTVIFCLFIVRELGFSLSLLRSRFLWLVLSILSEVLTYLLSEEESWVLFPIVLVTCAPTVFQELLRDRRWEERRFVCLQWVGPWSLSNHHWCPRLRHSSD